MCEIIFTLRPEAASEYGFIEKHLPGLSHAWYLLNNTNSLFNKYKSDRSHNK
jgi:hypothetical protein